jgi:hypothetical protein
MIIIKPIGKLLTGLLMAIFIAAGCGDSTNGGSSVDNIVELDGEEMEILWLDCLNVAHEDGMRRMVLELGDPDDTINFGIDGEGERPGIYIAHDGERWNAQYTEDSDNFAVMDENGARGDLELTWDRSVGTTWFDKDPDRPAMDPIHLVFDITCP